VSSPDPGAALTLEEARALAQQHGLSSLAARPGLGRYLRQLWERRQFVITLSAAQGAAKYERNRLGQLWSLLNPALLIVSYFLIFGLLLNTSRGVDNFIAFLSIGVVLFGVTATVISSGAKAISGNLGLVRALRFPRAALPISVALTELFTSWPAFLLLLVLMPVTGEPLTWNWLLFPVAVLLQMVQLTGLALIAARLVSVTQDLANFIPVMVRLMRYTSGVFFSIATFAAQFPPVVGLVLSYQPFALQLALGRQALMEEYPLQLAPWLASSGWAVLLLTVGMVVFWRGEGTYGRG
jgi:teichoic acid transport system permease protein